MRFTPDQLIDIQLAKGAFTRFFESPQINSIRVVNRQGYSVGHAMVRFVGPPHRPVSVPDKAKLARVQALRDFPQGPGRHFFVTNDMLHYLAQNKIRDVSKTHSELAPLINVVTGSPETFFQYCYSLLFDLGLFTGVQVRMFLREQLKSYLSRSPGSGSGLRSADLDRWSVGQFAGDTGVEVAFAATNLTTGLGTYFRAAPNRVPKRATPDTPDFPVLDAVAISSAYPFAFKPYAVFNRPDVPNGYWLDGGVQNNFPLHAFDSSADTPLAPGMLGIRLEASSQIFQKFLNDIKSYFDVSIPGFFLLYVFSLLETAMYPTEGGQIRTPQEKAQTVEIKIPAEVLSTLAFEPDAAQKRSAILIAFDAVAEYFVPGFDGERPPGPGVSVSAEEKLLRPARKKLSEKLAAG
jgi:predicted acylesterase/phospholipase RssA